LISCSIFPVLCSESASLANATTAAEVLEARDNAKVAYDAAKLAARLNKVKDAHDAVIAACRRAQADALVIEACRLAEEYDAAQERGEVQGHGGQGKRDIPQENIPSVVTDIGLTSKQVHQARKIRDAEKAKPGLIRKVLDEKLAAGEEPSRAQVQRAVKETVSPNTDGLDAATVIKQLTKMVAAIPSPGLRKQVQNLSHLLDVSIVDKKNGHQPELEALVLEINRATLRLEDCRDRLRKHTASMSEHGSETVTRKHDELRESDWVHGQLEKPTQERDTCLRTFEKVQSELANQAQEHIESVLHEGPKPALGEQECNAVELALNLSKELKEFEESGNRRVLIEAFRDNFLIARANANSRSEISKTIAIKTLINRIPDMNKNVLLKVMETLAKAGAGHLVKINKMMGIDQRGTPEFTRGGSRPGSNPVEDLGSFIEALSPR
jgi:hypothetical protein